MPTCVDAWAAAVDAEIVAPMNMPAANRIRNRITIPPREQLHDRGDPQPLETYIVRAFQYARTNWSPWIGPMFVWNIADPAWTPEVEQYWWSITNPDGTTRPAFDALTKARAAGGALP